MVCSFFPPEYSGAAKQAILLARHLRRLDHHVEFVTVRDPGLPAFEIYQGFTVHRIEVSGKRNQELPFWPNLFKFAWKNRHRFDILHCHGAHYITSIVGPIAKTVGCKSLVKATLSNDDLSGLKRSASGFVHHYFLKMVDAYVGISSDLVDEFIEKDFKKKKVYYIPNGVDTDRFRPVTAAEKEQVRKQLNLPPDVPILLSVGVFDHRKNIGWLIKEWAKNSGFGSAAFLLTIGPQSREDIGGEFLKSLKRIVSEHGQDMRLLEHVDNIDEYLKAADIFILPSVNEGLPNVVLEAMASGLPCLASWARGTKDLIIDEATGFLFQKNNMVDFSKKLLSLSNNPNHIVEMGLLARKIAKEKYSIGSIALCYHELYKNL